MQQPSCKKYITSFALLLDKIDPETISENSYCKKYLTHLLHHKIYYLHIYADVLDRLIIASQKKIAEIIATDIGTGNGLLGIFAKYCGFKKIFCNDINANFLQAAETLALKMAIDIDGFLLGDINQVKSFLVAEKINAVMATDVIEHIYDLDEYIGTLHDINPEMTSVFTTASNPENYFKVKQLQRWQIRDEEKGYDGDEADSNPHEAFLEMRKKIIRKHFKQLAENDILLLAKTTRGKIEKDIVKAVEIFISDGTVPVPAEDLNTCDPFTGSWTERILPIKKYEDIYSKHEFSLKIYVGFYNSRTPGLKKHINYIRNVLIFISGKKNSPFIGIVGYKK
jgi:hypothetical protein